MWGRVSDPSNRAQFGCANHLPRFLPERQLGGGSCVGRRGLSLDLFRRSFVSSRRRVSSLTGLDPMEPYPGLTPLAFLFRRFAAGFLLPSNYLCAIYVHLLVWAFLTQVSARFAFSDQTRQGASLGNVRRIPPRRWDRALPGGRVRDPSPHDNEGTMHKLLLALFSLTLFAAAPDQTQPVSIDQSSAPALTIYNQNFFVAREHLPLDLNAGVNHVNFAGISAHLEPDSVILRDLTGRP